MSKGGSGYFKGTNGARVQSQHGFVVGKNVNTTINNPIVNGTRVGSALKSDGQHSFSDIVDNYVSYATSFALKGGDGKIRTLYQLSGYYNGKVGIFEWIVSDDKKVSHRRFIPKGKITGFPNQKV